MLDNAKGIRLGELKGICGIADLTRGGKLGPI